MNYITALPDFMEIQRISFSWFLYQGVCDELSLFSVTRDFSRKVDMLIYSQEYKLRIPRRSPLEAKTDGKSYVAKLQMFVEVRDTTANIVLNRGKVSVVSIPLMTKESSFIINGCERTIISQIIRSPGIYFEKNKRQRPKKRDRIKLSTRVHYKRLFIYNPLIVLRFSGSVSPSGQKKSNLDINSQFNFDLYEFLKVYKYISTLLKPKNEIKLLLKIIFKASNLILNFNNHLELDIIKRLQELLDVGSAFISNKNSGQFFKQTFLKLLNKQLLISEPKLTSILKDFNTRKYFKTFLSYSLLRKQFTEEDLKDDKKYDISRENWYKKTYEEKVLYSATLIPEYGSWIRFSFQRDKRRDIIKHSLRVKDRFEDDIIVQIDKMTKKPVLHLLKELGLSDFEIQQNLQHGNFFYFNIPALLNSSVSKQPLPRFTTENFYRTVSESIKIFSSKRCIMGKIGRRNLNERLKLQVSSSQQTLVYQDVLAIIDQLITLSMSQAMSDDIDHLKNRRIRPVGELLRSLLNLGFQRSTRKMMGELYSSSKALTSNFYPKYVLQTFKEFFTSSQLSQYLDQTNPLSALTHKRRISGLGPGGFDRDRISFKVRDIHPSHYGRICPIETPEGQNVGLIASLTTCARVNKSGFLETAFWQVSNGKVLRTNSPIYLTADIEDLYKVASADTLVDKKNYFESMFISVRYNQDFMGVTPKDVDLIAASPIQIVSIATSLIPFFEHDDANRALMGSNMQRQAVPLLIPQKPLVGTGLENQVAANSRMSITAGKAGTITHASADKITLIEKSGKESTYLLKKYVRSNQETCVTERPKVWEGEKVKPGQIIIDGSAIDNGELALGKNVLVAYMPWHGYNFEDAILINERLVYSDLFTSIHIEKYQAVVREIAGVTDRITRQIPNIDPKKLYHLNYEGIIYEGTFVRPGDILVGRVTPTDSSDKSPEAKLLRAIFGAKANYVLDTSVRMPPGKYGRVITIENFNKRLSPGPTEIGGARPRKIRVLIAQLSKIQVGDKIAGRHGNKGIISRILPRQDMPFLPDGTPVDIILNPLGVPSRMNVGQLYECLLGLAGEKLKRRFKIVPFDEMFGLEISRILINKKLRQASLLNNEAWLFNPYSPGKMVLIDGRTGKEFENPITIGNAYILKLIHLVDKKIHARATGPYSLVTQQPLGGKANKGGQRFGEMEVWALEGFGAAYTLQELLTLKSDDMKGRNDTLIAIVRGEKIPKPGVPESFRVLLQELRCIGIEIITYRFGPLSSKSKYDIEVNLIENYNPESKRFYTTSNPSDFSLF